MPLMLAGAAAVALSLGGCGSSSAGHAANTHPDSVATTGQARSAPSAGAGHGASSTGGKASAAGASAAAAGANGAAGARPGGSAGAGTGAGELSSFRAAVNAACGAARSTVEDTTQSTARGGSSLAPSSYQAQRRAFGMLMLTQKLSRLKAPASQRASLAELIDSLRQLQHVQLLAASPQAASMAQRELSAARQRLTASADLAGAPECASIASATGVLAASPPGGQPGQPGQPGSPPSSQPGSQPGSPPQRGPELPRR